MYKHNNIIKNLSYIIIMHFIIHYISTYFNSVCVSIHYYTYCDLYSFKKQLHKSKLPVYYFQDICSNGVVVDVYFRLITF